MAKYLAAKASLGGGQRLPAVPRRLRLRLRVRRRAQVPRDAALPGGADLDQPDPVLRGRARARPAEVVLMARRSRASPSSRSSTRSPRRSARASSPTWARGSSRSSAPAAATSPAATTSACAGLASHFVWTNRSKESLTLDLKQPRALEVLTQLVGRADVLVQNLAPGAAARLGLSFEALHAAHPRLIVCDISGYGDDRRGRAVSRQEGLRPADPERVGLPVGHRHAGGAGQGGLLDRRHRRRHVRATRASSPR